MFQGILSYLVRLDLCCELLNVYLLFVQFSDGIKVIPEIRIAAWFLTQTPLLTITQIMNTKNAVIQIA